MAEYCDFIVDGMRDDVAVIRSAAKSYGYAKHLAGRFGVSTSLIRKVRSGELWQFG